MTDVGTSNGVALSSLLAAIKEIIQDAAYTDPLLIGRINDAVNAIAAGIRMPDGQISPPLPDLYVYGAVNTVTSLPYVSLPANYQRKVVRVYDSSNNIFSPPRGGDYYSYNLFLRQINNFGLAETGSIYRVAIKGSRIYYQGIPAASTTIGFHYYRKPAILTLDADIPEGIPEHLQLRLIKSYVIMFLYGEMIEAGVTEPAVGTKYHEKQFYTAMIDLCDFIGTPDAQPEYYGGGDFTDAGICD